MWNTTVSATLTGGQLTLRKGLQCDAVHQVEGSEVFQLSEAFGQQHGGTVSPMFRGNKLIIIEHSGTPERVQERLTVRKRFETTTVIQDK